MDLSTGDTARPPKEDHADVQTKVREITVTKTTNLARSHSGLVPSILH